MNTALAPVRSPDRDVHLVVPATSRGSSLTERLSLRVGLWLLLRSTALHALTVDPDAHRRRRDDDLARLRRERDAEREHLLHSIRL